MLHRFIRACVALLLGVAAAFLSAGPAFAGPAPPGPLNYTHNSPACASVHSVANIGVSNIVALNKGYLAALSMSWNVGYWDSWRIRIHGPSGGLQFDRTYYAYNHGGGGQHKYVDYEPQTNYIPKGSTQRVDIQTGSGPASRTCSLGW